ncbi:multiple sugar transport system substrate-binding protein [Mesorhizobium albiziae]|uniref:Multiple sugar transport system substrate-binding protein n=1 Tax=Neomesorhizobium albiziae TaxID=335020 RepID=A0A1I4E5W1_9HYPH|nr:sugar ABC transporter substrate-binding protein [Mesorhizobium albiziae]GLS32493.1 sugar ABC transporter substrate-binding protein [Mesorhizobium albiziae]SFL00330.1 multiple sugar transport system substrate-binding protein [Mesorhizobium albiziae]
MKTATIALAASALALTIMSSHTSAEELRFTVWTGNEAHLKMLNGFAESFKASHPDVSVKFETIPPADYTQKLTFQLAGGNPPDAGWLMEDAAPTFANAGVLEDVAPTLNQAQGYNFADFSKPALGLWTASDTVYGIPFSTSPFVIFYNKDLFDKAGLEDPLALAAKGEWDMARFQEVAKKLKETTGKWGFEFKDGQGYDSRIMHALMPPIRAYGGDVWANKECGFDKPEAVAAVQQLHDMVFKDQSIVPPGEQGDYFSGNAAMTINQISRASLMEKAGFKWGIAPLPTGPGGESPVIGQAGIVVFTAGKQKQLAADFVAHMTNAENVAIAAQFFPPARTSVLESDAFVTSNKLIPAEQMKIVADAIAKGKVLPSHDKSPQILTAMKPRVDALWRPDANVEASLKAVCEAIQPLL